MLSAGKMLSSELHPPGLKGQLSHLRAVWPEAKYFFSPSFLYHLHHPNTCKFNLLQTSNLHKCLLDTSTQISLLSPRNPLIDTYFPHHLCCKGHIAKLELFFSSIYILCLQLNENVFQLQPKGPHYKWNGLRKKAFWFFSKWFFLVAVQNVHTSHDTLFDTFQKKNAFKQCELGPRRD